MQLIDKKWKPSTKEIASHWRKKCKSSTKKCKLSAKEKASRRRKNASNRSKKKKNANHQPKNASHLPKKMKVIDQKMLVITEQRWCTRLVIYQRKKFKLTTKEMQFPKNTSFCCLYTYCLHNKYILTQWELLNLYRALCFLYKNFNFVAYIFDSK